MGIHLNWLDSEQKAVLWTFDADWTIEAFYRVVELCGLMVGNQPFDIVVDMAKVQGTPSEILNLFAARQMSLPQNYGVMIVVSDNLFITRLLSVLNRQPLSRNRYLFVSTLDEARVLVEERRRAG
jgi:hypothetical protein